MFCIMVCPFIFASRNIRNRSDVSQSLVRFPEFVPQLGWRENEKRKLVKVGPYNQEEKDALKAALIKYAKANDRSAKDLSWVAETKRT